MSGPERTVSRIGDLRINADAVLRPHVGVLTGELDDATRCRAEGEVAAPAAESPAIEAKFTMLPPRPAAIIRVTAAREQRK